MEKTHLTRLVRARVELFDNSKSNSINILTRKMLQSTAVVVAIATILLISALPYSGAKSIGEKYDEIVRARQQQRFHYRRPWSPPDQDKSNQFKAQSNKFTTKEARHIKLATRKNIGEEQYGELLRARHQEAFHYRRTPEYDESNHFTAEEAQVMREARRKEKEMLKAMGISEQQEKAKISLLFESQKVKADEEQVNERKHKNMSFFNANWHNFSFIIQFTCIN